MGDNLPMISAPVMSRHSAVLVATILASSMSHLTSTAIGVALPALQADLSIGGAGIIWVVNAYALFLSSLVLVGGALGDRLGRKEVFAFGVALFSLAAVACGLARRPEALIVARAVQGIGGALMVPGSLAVLSACVPPDTRGRAIGVWSTFTALTLALGPVVAGWLAGAGLWRAVFLINAPLAVIVLVATARIPKSLIPPDDRGIDWPGAALIAAGVAALTVGLTEGPGRGWRDPLIVAALAVGALALAGFVAVQARSSHPLVPLQMFRSRVFTAGNLLTFLLYMALAVVFFFLPLNLIQTQGYPAGTAGLATLPFMLLVTALSPWAGGFVDRVGSRLPVTLGPLIAGAGMLALGLPGLTGGPADYWWTFFPGMVLLGIGMGITVAPLTTAVMKAVPDSLAGAASGTNNAVASTGGVLAVAIMGAVALTVFGALMGNAAAGLPIDDGARAALVAETTRLGGAAVPPAITGEAADAAALALRRGFANTFRLLMFLCAGLSWAGALAWYLLCRGKRF